MQNKEPLPMRYVFGKDIASAAIEFPFIYKILWEYVSLRGGFTVFLHVAFASIALYSLATEIVLSIINAVFDSLWGIISPVMTTIWIICIVSVMVSIFFQEFISESMEKVQQKITDMHNAGEIQDSTLVDDFERFKKEYKEKHRC